MAKHSYLKVIVLMLIIAGCEEYKYSIEMKPNGQGVERKLVCSGNFSNEELERIAGLYENRIDQHTFSGKFDANLPNDVGGAGFYSTFNTDMGKATIYSERFRGNDNLNDTLEKAQLQVDRIVDFLIGWLGHELGDDPNFVHLKTFCNENLRSDLKNLMIYMWLSNVLQEHKSADSNDITIRMMHYFVERGYFGQKEAFLLMVDSNEGTEKTAYNFARRFIAGKMGYSDPNIVTERLNFLSDEEHIEKSIEQYIRTTDLFTKAWEEKKLKENDPNVAPPETSDIMISMLEGMWFDIDFLAPTYTIEVKLTCDSKPIINNGQWDEKTNQVVWLSEIAGDEKLPTFFYASWSEPNREYQQEHFGRVVLSDEDLAQYCIWRENLDEGSGKEWDSFVLSLTPAEDLEVRLKAFRFSIDQKKGLTAEEDNTAKEPCELILAGLKSEKEAKEDIKTQTDQE